MTRQEKRARWRVWVLGFSGVADYGDWTQALHLPDARRVWRERVTNCPAMHLSRAAEYRRRGNARGARLRLQLARNGGALTHNRPDLP